MIKKISTNKAPAAIGPYSQAMVFNGIVFTSGQIAINPDTGLIPDGIQAQTEQIMQNLKHLLEASGSSLENAVKTTCFLSDMNNFAAFNEVYAKYFTTNPARSCVAVKELPKGVLAEVEVIAAEK